MDFLLIAFETEGRMGETAHKFVKISLLLNTNTERKKKQQNKNTESHVPPAPPRISMIK